MILLALVANISFAQEIKIDSCGVNSSGYLNHYEADYFNEIFRKRPQYKNFRFKGKSIAFAEGNLGYHGVISKKAILITSDESTIKRIKVSAISYLF